MQSISEDTFWQFEKSYWIKYFNSSEDGFSQQKALELLKQSNTIPKNNTRFEKDFKLLIGQFKSPLMLLLIGAVFLSAFLGDTSDVFIILFIVLSTGLLSFFQERNASRVVEKLQSLISLKSIVLRDQKPVELPSSDLVPGDILILKAGDIIPADCLIIDSTELYSNEASLTGESYPTRKYEGVINADTELSKRTNCLWKGTSIVSGKAKAIVIQLGDKTILGSIAQSINKVVETTFEKGIKDFGFFLMKITLILSVFILLINLANHKSPIESALFALALAVGMAPELLPAITTIAMSAGAKRMLEKKVIVKKLASIQNLGEVNLLCTDKTGTITEGSIKISKWINGEGEESLWVKKIAYWNAIFESGYSNPIDEALKQLRIEEKTNPIKLGEIPYDFIRKRLSISIQTEKDILLITKGAFHQIIEICTSIELGNRQTENIEHNKEKLEQQYERFGKEGLRVIAICYKKISSAKIQITEESEMIFAGFIIMEDPIKDGIKEAISELHKLHIGLKIITGDNKNVAHSIASKIGILNPKILTGPDILKMSPEALSRLVTQTHIFAEVEPQQKEQLIIAMRKTYTVAYIGDGINDVSAINAADVGISVENATDVAREAADFVLMEKSLMVLVDGIKEGRKTFANTLKYIFINTGSTFGNMFSVAVASLILPFLPMLPKQILLMNFITDFPYLTVASDNVDQDQLIKPGKWDLKFIRNYMIIFGLHSSIFDIITFFTLYYVLKSNESSFQTGWFIESILTELFILFIIRTQKNFFKSKPGNYLFILSCIGLVITISIPYMPIAYDIGLRPLPMINFIAMLIIVTFYIITVDFLKVWFFKKYKST